MNWRVKLLCLCLVTLGASACDGLDSEVLAVCGNGKIEKGETCDDGYTDACGTCNADCSAAGAGSGRCGDGERCPEFEACDDGYADACGSCNADCTGAGSGSTCGDGTTCPELEACDDGYTDACGSCNADCSAAGSGSTCGDGTICPEVETCDDGYTDACGTCNANCSAAGSGSTCGDGAHCPESEACDDGYNDACGTCNASCTAAGSGATCGDGTICPELETCDDGFADACGSCNADCTGSGSGATCGDEEWCPEQELCDGTVNCYTCLPVIFVDADASAGGDGTSWANAYRYLQDGLAAARELQSPVEIWVAEGTYRPDESEHAVVIPSDPEASFEIQSDMALYGGFSGGESSRFERNWEDNKTILSGDLGQNDLPDFANRSDNSCHVVKIWNTDATARLDGVVVQSGHAVQCVNDWGGGIHMMESSAVIANCELSDNDASNGGGMYIRGRNPTVVDTRFLANKARHTGGGLREQQTGSLTTVRRCEFMDNRAFYGGGMYGRVSVEDSLFVANYATEDGGGVIGTSNDSQPTVVTNTRFFGNTSGWLGGGMSTTFEETKIENCVFSGNWSRWGGAVRGGSIVNSTLVGNVASDSGGGVVFASMVKNSILVGNSPNQKSSMEERAISSSCVEGLKEGYGNIVDCVPLFVDADGADDILGTVDDDLRLQAGSPGIDAGSNYALPADTFDLDGDGDVDEPLPVDLDGNPRRVDAEATDTGIGDAPLVDMGAYEHQ